MDLGPFKHRIDDGLELRKAAFEALDILLGHVPHVLQGQPDFLGALRSGLADHADVKAPAHLMLVKLAGSPGAAAAAAADPAAASATPSLAPSAVHCQKLVPNATKCHLSVNGAICDGMTQSIYTYMHRGSGRTAAAAGAVGRPAGEDADSTT